jgi:hypothetical protein
MTTPNRNLLGSLLAQPETVRAVRNPSGTISVTFGDLADEVVVMGSPAALLGLSNRIMVTVCDAIGWTADRPADAVTP